MQSTTMTNEVERPLPIFRNAPNFRDLGGLATIDGRRVAYGRIFRTGALTHLSLEEWDDFTALNICRYYDLRSPGERKQHVIGWPEPGPTVVALEVLPDVRATGEEVLRKLITDPSGRATRELMMTNYAHMPVALAPKLPNLFEELADIGQLPVAIACTAGQDRTGFVCALLLLALGVSYETVLDDYLRSAENYDVERTRAFIAKALDIQLDEGPSDATMSALRANSEYLDSAFGVIEQDFGGMEAYLRSTGGVSDKLASRLRSAFLDPISEG